MTKIRTLINLLPPTLICVCGQPASANDLDWPEPKVENRPGSYWWWMGSAVNTENITYNLGKKGTGDLWTPNLNPHLNRNLNPGSVSHIRIPKSESPRPNPKSESKDADRGCG